MSFRVWALGGLGRRVQDLPLKVRLLGSISGPEWGQISGLQSLKYIDCGTGW